MCLACVDCAGEWSGCHCDVSSRPTAVIFLFACWVWAGGCPYSARYVLARLSIVIPIKSEHNYEAFTDTLGKLPRVGEIL